MHLAPRPRLIEATGDDLHRLFRRDRPCAQEDGGYVLPPSRRSGSFVDHPGVTSYDISLEKQEVIVHTAVDYETILAKIKKTGKEVKSGEVVAA